MKPEVRWSCLLIGHVPWPGLPDSPSVEKWCGLEHESRDKAERCGFRMPYEIWESREVPAGFHSRRMPA